jgi:hypothetical protein
MATTSPVGTEGACACDGCCEKGRPGTTGPIGTGSRSPAGPMT